MVRRIALLTAVIWAMAGIEPAAAQTYRRLIPFQARLADGGGQAVADGVYGMTFAIYDAAEGGAPIWIEHHPTISVIGGQVNVLLGSLSATPLDGISFGGAPRFLGVTLGPAPAGQLAEPAGEMVPRHELVPAFHARSADIASAVEAGKVTASMLAANAVTQDKIANGAVAQAKIAANAVTTDKIADGTIRGADISTQAGQRISGASIADKTVTRSHLGDDVLDAVVPAGTIVIWAGEESTIPTGWYPCDGRVLNKTDDPGLFNALSAGNPRTPIYGFNPGVEGSFKLPDYRGYFVRGWATEDPQAAARDPDRGSRRNRGDGKGGNLVGTYQPDEVGPHRHTLPAGDGRYNDASGGLARAGSGMFTGTWTGSETRPKNIAVVFIIKR